MKNSQKFYEVKVEENVDKTSPLPYEFTIIIQYTDEIFQARMKNVLAESPIVLCIQQRGIITSLITKSKQRVFFEDSKDIAELNRNLLRNPIETFSFKGETITFFYKKRRDGEEEIRLIQKAIGELLEEESKVYESIV
ncbi:hypothetical protein [Bacillus cereus]|uniref:hypothetical protein n=1 Tax=Bacillus cereus TaxID=1396 RepID=UPI0034D5BC77